ncbi:hypothetical protein WN51_12120 [Melipona quadrifasciata]|uniref:Uncharacterized protein n=1 Tax=Melipona quadrifasciata TaxID=166423 RepID=A0A0M9A5S7_9HYME|nr:hypothetical protein WN51_12120 [Melipona quadrifasciata]
MNANFHRFMIEANKHRAEMCVTPYQSLLEKWSFEQFKSICAAMGVYFCSTIQQGGYLSSLAGNLAEPEASTKIKDTLEARQSITDIYGAPDLDSESPDRVSVRYGIPYVEVHNYSSMAQVPHAPETLVPKKCSIPMLLRLEFCSHIILLHLRDPSTPLQIGQQLFVL